ncbi:SPFH domain-containing protein [Thiosocius teredinicola]|uniref:SPFH domain-containing protein n=1 Tax=Thiosocius teredinicola TaxID=1973002 RepID=UPI000990CCC9
MFNLIRYVKSDPSTYLFQYRNGEVVREGLGLSFYYFVPSSTLVAVPMVSVDKPFMFAETTVDFQEVTIQGRVVYRVTDPGRLSQMANFALAPKGNGYASEDPSKLGDRILNQVQVMVRAEIQSIPLVDALVAGDGLTQAVSRRLQESARLEELGIEVMDLAILAVKPTPETARALEAEMRERVLQDADEAVYRRRNAAVDQERAIKENELQTDIAVARKEREVREAEMEAKRSVAEKQRAIEQEALEGSILLEEQRQKLVETTAANSRMRAEAKAYAIKVIMQAVSTADPKVLDAITSSSMGPEQLIARSFQGIAERADKIGQLNISPELLSSLLGDK